MKSRTLFLAALLSGVMGSQHAFGWGNATHVYFAKHLGVQVGTLNLNEIYGAVLPDMFNLEFTEEGQTLAYAFHWKTDLMSGLYSNAPSRASKAAFYGFYSHNNAWGADYTAHDNGRTVGNKGWIISQADRFSPKMVPYIAQILIDAGLDAADPTTTKEVALGTAQLIAPDMAHDLIETAVDVLVRRCLDPLVGARLYYAAKERSNEIPLVIARVLKADVEAMKAGEKLYQEGMMQYGQMFMLPEDQLVAMIGEMSAKIATGFLQVKLAPAVAAEPLPGLKLEKISVDAAKVSEFLVQAIDQVKPVFRNELSATLCYLEKEMPKHGITPAGPVWALWKDDGIESELLALDANVPAPETPAEFSVDQNYPNPFNPTTSIAYVVPSDVRVSLRVYNSLGQEVATLVDETRVAGRYTAVWDAGGMSSGVYFYRLQAGDFVSTKRMTLVK